MNKISFISIIFIVLFSGWLIFRIVPRDHKPTHVSSNSKKEPHITVTEADTNKKRENNDKSDESGFSEVVTAPVKAIIPPAKTEDLTFSTTTHEPIRFEVDTLNSEEKDMSTSVATADINAMDTYELVETIKKYKDETFTGGSPIDYAMSRLFALSTQSDPEAIYELINLSYELDGHEIEHRIFQALGRARQPDANQALTDAIGRNLDSRKQILRITSYIRPTVYSNTLETFIVDKLIDYSKEPGLNSEARKALISKVMRMGGDYGRDQVRSHSLLR